MLGKEIPELMKLIQKEEAQAVAKQKTEAPIKGVWNLVITCSTKPNSQLADPKITFFDRDFN